jgi:anti-sigma regulatory factor (Ser/Thr protein kinase)
MIGPKHDLGRHAGPAEREFTGRNSATVTAGRGDRVAAGRVAAYPGRADRRSTPSGTGWAYEGEPYGRRPAGRGATVDGGVGSVMLAGRVMRAAQHPGFAHGGPAAPPEPEISWFVTRGFECTARNVAVVRHYVTDTFSHALADRAGELTEADEDRIFRAALCTSELATNCYDHSASGQGEGTMTVSVFLRPTALRVEIIDAGAESVPHAKSEIIEPGRAEQVEDGRGLVLVKGVADECGTYADEVGRTTWIEIDRGTTTPGADGSRH